MLKIISCVVALTASASPAMNVDAILDSMEANENPRSARMEITQTVHNPSGRRSRSRLVSYSIDEGDKGLMEYVSPARIEGMKILMLDDGDEIWFYSPRTSRVRKIASHQRNQSVAGSDFSYEDMSSRDMRTDYTPKLLDEEERNGEVCYKIEMTAKSGDETYPRILLWVDKEKYVTVEARFFDETGQLWKELTVSDIEKIAGYWTPKTVRMRDVLKGSRTVMTMDSIEYDLELDAGMFSERALRR